MVGRRDRIPRDLLAGLALEIPRDLSAGLGMDRIPRDLLAGLALETPRDLSAGLAVGQSPWPCRRSGQTPQRPWAAAIAVAPQPAGAPWHASKSEPRFGNSHLTL